MGRNRGKRSWERGKLAGWKGRKANRGRKGSLGKKKGFPRWQEVRATIMRRKTQIIVPSKEERDAAKAEAKAEAAAEAATTQQAAPE